MIFSDLVVTICLIVAVGIVGAAIAWALMETRHDIAHHNKRPLARLKSRKHPPLKAQDR